MPGQPVRVDLSGEAKLGAGLSAPDFSHFTPGTPAFWSLALFVVLVVVIVAIAKSLR